MPDQATPHVEVAGYLLGKLEGEEAERFRGHLQDCAECQREIEELSGLPDLLARAVLAQPAPPGLRARTLAAVRAAAAEAAPAAAARPARRRWLALAVAAVLVLALAIPGALLLQGRDRAQVTELALVAAEGGPARGRVEVTTTAAGREFDVHIEGLDPPPPGTLYELWVVGPGDTLDRPQRVSLGTFTVGADRQVRLRAFTAAPADRYPRVGVTREPLDGNPARTGPRVLVPG